MLWCREISGGWIGLCVSELPRRDVFHGRGWNFLYCVRCWYVERGWGKCRCQLHCVWVCHVLYRV